MKIIGVKFGMFTSYSPTEIFLLGKKEDGNLKRMALFSLVKASQYSEVITTKSNIG